MAMRTMTSVEDSYHHRSHHPSQSVSYASAGETTHHAPRPIRPIRPDVYQHHQFAVSLSDLPYLAAPSQHQQQPYHDERVPTAPPSLSYSSDSEDGSPSDMLRTPEESLSVEEPVLSFTPRPLILQTHRACASSDHGHSSSSSISSPQASRSEHGRLHRTASSKSMSHLTRSKSRTTLRDGSSGPSISSRQQVMSPSTPGASSSSSSRRRGFTPLGQTKDCPVPCDFVGYDEDGDLLFADAWTPRGSPAAGSSTQKRAAVSTGKIVSIHRRNKTLTVFENFSFPMPPTPSSAATSSLSPDPSSPNVSRQGLAQQRALAAKGSVPPISIPTLPSAASTLCSKDPYGRAGSGEGASDANNCLAVPKSADAFFMTHRVTASESAVGRRSMLKHSVSASAAHHSRNPSRERVVLEDEDCSGGQSSSNKSSAASPLSARPAIAGLNFSRRAPSASSSSMGEAANSSSGSTNASAPPACGRRALPNIPQQQVSGAQDQQQQHSRPRFAAPFPVRHQTQQQPQQQPLPSSRSQSEQKLAEFESFMAQHSAKLESSGLGGFSAMVKSLPLQQQQQLQKQYYHDAVHVVEAGDVGHDGERGTLVESRRGIESIISMVDNFIVPPSVR